MESGSEEWLLLAMRVLEIPADVVLVVNMIIASDDNYDYRLL